MFIIISHSPDILIGHGLGKGGLPLRERHENKHVPLGGGADRSVILCLEGVQLGRENVLVLPIQVSSGSRRLILMKMRPTADEHHRHVWTLIGCGGEEEESVE